MNEIQKIVGERIAEIRKYNRVSQTDFADKLGKSLRTVQKYESGEIDIPLSTLADIAKILNTTMNYLVGYDSSHIKTETLSDVLAFFFEIDKKRELSYDIGIKKVGKDGKWQCSFIFNGEDTEAMHNADLCIVMETFRNNRDAIKTYWMDYEAYDAWEAMKLEYYSKCTLTDKEREVLQGTDLIKKRNELDRQKVEKILAEKQVHENVGDNE